MAAYYGVLLRARPVEPGMAYREFRDELRDGQAAWLTGRRARCASNAHCLERAYRDRIAVLDGLAQAHLGLVFRAGSQAGASSAPVDYGDATLAIDGKKLTLDKGAYTAPVAPGSAALRHTRVFGEPAFGTIGGRPAAAVFIADDGGGSGQFFYVAVTFGDGRATVPALIGDRIAPRSLAVRDGRIVATFLDRGPDQPMASAPTVPKTAVFTFDTARDALVPVADAGSISREPDKRAD